MRLTRFVPLYAVLVLVLALIGGFNQVRYRHQARLIEHKSELHELISDLRTDAAQIQGPLAVGAWARQTGMVPSPEVGRLRHVAYFPAPQAQASPAGLEMRTIWR
ncbi:MAG: hypothetical protein WD314_15830 [Trueperaceae bacterium]